MDNIQQVLTDAERKLNQKVDQTKQEKLFAIEAEQRFEKNLIAFQEYYPNIAKIISEYETREDFCLHVTTSGFANFYPKDSSYPLYDDDPVEQSKQQLAKAYENPFISRTSFEGVSISSADERIHVVYMRKLYEYLHSVGEKEETRISHLPEHFPSGICFGIGLGYYLPQLLQEHTFDYLFICEPDIELFFASLFCINWSRIITKIDEDGCCLFLNIGVPYEEFFETMRTYSNDIGAFSVVKSFCYQHYPSVEVNKQIKEFFSRYYETQFGFGFYNDAVTGLAHGIMNAEIDCNFLLPLSSSNAPLKDVPVFIIGNGPSLDDAETFLKQHHSDAIIISAGTALGSLKKMGITPDFHVLVERPKITYDILLQTEEKDFYKDLNLLTVELIYPDVLDLFKWTGIGLKGPEAASNLLSVMCLKKFGAGMNSLPFCGPLVSNTALSYALMLGFDNVYLFGVDNGYQESGKSHSKHSIYYDEKFKKEHIVDPSARHVIDGNLGGTVRATSLLNVSKIQMEGVIRAKKKASFFNVGEGAKITGATPLQVNDILLTDKLDDKPALIEYIKNSKFRKLNLTNFEQQLNFELLDEITENLVCISQEEFTTRKEASDLLKRQSRYIYSFRKTEFAHYFNVFKGSLLYYHCPMISLIYSIEDEELALAYFKESLAIWIEYLQSINVDFKNNWNEKCGWGLDQRTHERAVAAEAKEQAKQAKVNSNE